MMQLVTNYLQAQQELIERCLEINKLLVDLYYNDDISEDVKDSLPNHFGITPEALRLTVEANTILLEYGESGHDDYDFLETPIGYIGMNSEELIAVFIADACEEADKFRKQEQERQLKLVSEWALTHGYTLVKMDTTESKMAGDKA